MRPALTSAKDVLLGVSPWVRGERRHGLGSLTTAELGRAIGGEVTGARLLAHDVEIDSRGTTDRARLRLDWNAAGRAAGLPPSAFAKGTPSQPGPRAIVSAFGCHTYEARFFEQIQPAVADLTVAPYVVRAGAGGRYVVALEDLTLRDATVFAADDEAPKEHVEAVIDLLARLHGRFWRSARFDRDLSWVQTMAARPGSSVTRRLVRWSAKRVLDQDRDVPDPVRRLTQTYVDHHPAFVEAWEAMPPTLCHGDTHLGNTFAHPDGTAGIYDWQVCHRMDGLRDVAYFLTHSVPTELRRAEEGNLLRRYLDGLAEAGAGQEAPSYDEAFDRYRLLTVDGWVAVLVTLAAERMQPGKRVEVAAERALRTLVDLDVEQAVDAVARGAE